MLIVLVLSALAGCVGGGVDQAPPGDEPETAAALRIEATACQAAGLSWLVDGDAAQDAAGPHWTVSRTEAGLASLYILNLVCPDTRYSGVQAPSERFLHVGINGSFTEPPEKETDSTLFALDVIAPEGSAVKAFFEDVGIATTAGTAQWEILSASLEGGVAISWEVETDTGSADGEYVLIGEPADFGKQTLTIAGRPAVGEGPLPRLVGDDSNVGIRQLGPSYFTSDGDTWWSRLEASPTPNAAWLVTDATFDLTLEITNQERADD